MENAFEWKKDLCIQNQSFSNRNSIKKNCAKPLADVKPLTTPQKPRFPPDKLRNSTKTGIGRRNHKEVHTKSLFNQTLKLEIKQIIAILIRW